MAGVRIRVHASFLLLLVLILLAGSATTAWGALAETGWIAFIFACVVVHELAHSITATRLGVRVKDILLLPLGGASEMDRIPDDPRREMAIAGAGPAASLVLGVIALSISAAVGQHWWPPGVIGGPIIARMGWVNVLLAGFNLLPVLPMDGGRLLRASLESRLGRTGSTITAARIGRIGGAVFIVVGLLYDIWLAFIGAFILLGAGLESADAKAHEKLSGTSVELAMMAWPWTAEEHLRIHPTDLDRTFARQGVLPVTADGRYVGTIGPEQRSSVAAGATAGEAADREAPVVAPDEPLDHALDALQRSEQPAVAVVSRDGVVRGIVTAETLGRALARTGDGPG